MDRLKIKESVSALLQDQQIGTAMAETVLQLDENGQHEEAKFVLHQAVKANERIAMEKAAVELRNNGVTPSFSEGAE